MPTATLRRLAMTIALAATVIVSARAAGTLSQDYGRLGTRTLQPETALAGAVVVAADEFLPQARELAAALAKRTGAAPRVISAGEAGDDPWASQLILLGHYGNNTLIERLYGLRLTPVDGWYPGAGGFLLHPVCDPFARGRNAIVLGCSDAAGASAATAAFIESIGGEGSAAHFPWVTRSKVTVGEDPRVASALAATDAIVAKWNAGDRGKIPEREGIEDELFNGLRDTFVLGDAYAFTGKEEYGKAFARRIEAAGRIIGAMSDIPPGRLSGWSPMFASSVRLLEPSPILNEAQRRAMIESYARAIEWDMNEKYVVGFLENFHKGELPLLRRNKYIFSSLGIYLGLQYFTTYYPGMEEEARWRELVDLMFGKIESLMCMDDATNYFFHVPVTTLRYAAASGDERLMAEVVRMAHLLTMFVDPLGENTQIGDGAHFTKSSSLYWGHSALYGAGAHYGNDPMLAGVFEKVKNNNVGLTLRDLDWPIFMFNPGIKGTLPETVNRIEAFPLDDAYYKDIYNDQSEMHFARMDRPDPPNVDLEHAFFKMTWREGWGEQDQYMMLDGVNGAIHNDDDGNTINSLADGGRIWLADRSYVDSNEKYHNGLTIIRDGNRQARSYLVSLDRLADMEETGYTATTSKDYNGADWTRHTFWTKGEHFVVFDEVNYLQPGEYVLQNYWHVIGEPRREESTVAAIQRDRGFALVNADGASIEMTPRRQYALSMWADYPYFAEGHEPAVTAVRQIKVNRVKPGERQLFMNLLIAGEGEKIPAAKLRRLGENLAAIDAPGGGSTVVGLRGIGGEGDALRTDAAAFLLAPDRISLVQATRLDLAGSAIAASAPADFEIDLATGTVSPSTAALTLDGKALAGGTIPADRLRSAYGSWLTARAQAIDAPTSPAAPADIRQAPADGPGGIDLRRIVTGGGQATCFLAADLGDGRGDTLLVGTLDSSVIAFDRAGKELWRRGVSAPVNALAVADFGDRRVIAAALEDWNVQTLAADGTPVWTKQLEIPSRLPESLKGVTTIAAASRKDGGDDLVLGTAVLDVYRLDREGNVIWRNEGYHRGVLALTVGDFDGDGAGQAVVGMEWSLFHMEQDAKLVRLRSVSRGYNWLEMATVRLPGDPLPMIVAGGTNGRIECVDPRKNRSLWWVALGAEISALATIEAPAGSPAVFAGSESMYVHAIAADGTELWRRRLTDRVESLLPFGEGADARLVAGTADGMLWMLNAGNGRILGHERTGEEPIIGPIVREGDGFVIATADGQLVSAPMTETKRAAAAR